MAKGASDEDIELFRNALDGVTRLEPDRVTPPRKRVAAIPAQRLADNEQVVRDLGYANPTGQRTKQAMSFGMSVQAFSTRCCEN